MRPMNETRYKEVVSGSARRCYASRHSVIVVMMESVAMSEHGVDTPERVLKFVPKEWPNSYGAQVEEVGQAIVAKIQRAEDLSNKKYDRAMELAHNLTMQLR